MTAAAVGPFPGDADGAQTEEGHPRGEPAPHHTQAHGHLTRPGQGGEPTQVLITNPGRDLGIHRTDPFEQGGHHLGPQERVVTSDDHEPLGQHPRLPGRLGRDPTPGVERDHRSHSRVGGEETQTETVTVVRPAGRKAASH